MAGSLVGFLRFPSDRTNQTMPNKILRKIWDIFIGWFGICARIWKCHFLAIKSIFSLQGNDRKTFVGLNENLCAICSNLFPFGSLNDENREIRNYSLSKSHEWSTKEVPALLYCLAELVWPHVCMIDHLDLLMWRGWCRCSSCFLSWLFIEQRFQWS